MRIMNDRELNNKIDSFLYRKTQEYPELDRYRDIVSR